MNNYNDFMNWCLYNNHNDNKFLEFKKTPGNVDAYIEFIDLSRRDKDVLKMVAKLEKSFFKTCGSGDENMDRSLRMTTLDMNHVIGL